VIHKPEKDSKNKELAEIKRENQQLKRKLARAEKAAQKLLENSALVVEADPDLPDAPRQAPANACPTCNEALTVVGMGPKTLHACKGCGWRKVT
jgi:hypothetical protein